MADSPSGFSSEVDPSIPNGNGQIAEEKDSVCQPAIPRKSSVLKKDGRGTTKRALQKSVSFSARPEDKRIINGETVR